MPQFASYPSLAGRPVFVSGGGSGIGASIVEHFAEQGAHVVAADINLEAARQTIEGLGDNAMAVAKGVETFKIAVALAVGIVLVLALPGRLFEAFAPCAGKKKGER